MELLRLELPCSVSESAQLGSHVKRISLAIGASNAEANAFELCAIEAFNNAAEHACAEDERLKIRCAVDFSDGVLTLTITDWGARLDPERIRNAKMPEPVLDDPSTWSVRGRGLPIMTTLMDEVSYVSDAEENTLTLKKSIGLALVESNAAGEQS